VSPRPSHDGRGGAGPTWPRAVTAAVAALAVLVVAAVLVTADGPVLAGHPVYPVLLAATLLVAAVALVRAVRRRRRPLRRSAGRRVAGLLVAVLAVAWVAALWWLRPFGAQEPALAALASDDVVTVTQTPTTLVLAPAGAPEGTTGTALLLQPGARVDARAYAAVVRPLAAAGHLVVVPKQPLGIGFLALGALDAAREAHPDVERWVVGGHSLGGTAAAVEAVDAGDDGAPVVGLLLWASYPADDVSSTLDARVLSVSASEDDLATPADITASVADLPPGADLVVVEGAVHAFFGDYGPQPGDGTPTVDRATARAEITAASLGLLDEVSG